MRNPFGRFWGGDETREVVHMGKSKFYLEISKGRFPAPVKIGRRSFWLESEVIEWMAQRVAERDVKQRESKAD